MNFNRLFPDALKGPQFLALLFAVVVALACFSLVNQLIALVFVPVLEAIFSTDLRTATIGLGGRADGVFRGREYGIFIGQLLISLPSTGLVVAGFAFALRRSWARSIEDSMECPYCLSRVPIEAVKCAYCTSELPEFEDDEDSQRAVPV